ncbi:hypothetical protein HWV62_21848 [Athelia sp. TMB]|nr:hypothetical protein HWV62_21848 [Athelia sp. TMB]
MAPRQKEHLFESLLPFRVLAHATLALVWQPLIVAYITFEYEDINDWKWCLLCLISYGIFGGVGYMDYFAITHKINKVFNVVADIALILVLPLSMWDISFAGLFFATNFEDWRSGDNTYDTEFGILTLLPFMLSLLYVIILGWVAAYHKILGIGALFYPGPEKDSDRGSPPEDPDTKAKRKHCLYFLDHHSYFRKHSFEPRWLAALRGSVAVLAVICLLLFSVYLGLDATDQYVSGSRTITESSTPVLQAAYASDSYSLSVTASTWDGRSPIPSDFKVQEITGTVTLGNYTNLTNSYGAHLPPNQVWLCPSTSSICNHYPFGLSRNPTSMGFSAQWSGEADIALWPTVSATPAWIDSVQVNYTDPLLLGYGMNYNIALTIVSYKRNNISWLHFSSEIVHSVATTDSSTTATFRFHPFQRVVVQQDLSQQTIFMLVIHIFSNIGGIFAFIELVYAIIFGRTVVAIVMGSRPISPFGLFGMVAHKYFKKAINKDFPRMYNDIAGIYDIAGANGTQNLGQGANERMRGIAGYISEVAIDTALVWTEADVKQVAEEKAEKATKEKADKEKAAEEKEMNRASGAFTQV